MSRAGFLLTGIEKFLGASLISYFMVQEDGEKLYICFGKRAFFLVDFNSGSDDDPPRKEKYFYAWVTDVIEDIQDSTLFMIRFKEGRQSLCLNSSVREQLLDEFHVCWKTDYMYRKWEVCNFPLKKGEVPFARKLIAAEEFTKQWEGYDKHVYQDYFFFLPKQYRPVWSTKTRRFIGEYRKEGSVTGELYRVQQTKPKNVSLIGPLEKSSLKIEAEAEARKAVPNKDSGQKKIQASQPLTKRMNLTGDVASYLGYFVHMRTEPRDLAVLVVRRRFIPPEGDLFQDIIVHYLGPERSAQKSKMLLENMQNMLDSVSPVRPVQFYDDTLATVKSNGLLYDEESYVWFAGMGFSVHEHVDQGGRQLFKSVCHLLYSDDKLLDIDPETVEKSAPLVDDPFDIIQDMDSDAPGLTQQSPQSYWECWKEKVARYVAFILDGGLHPETISIQKLATFVTRLKFKNSKSEDITKRLLDHAMYIRPSNPNEQYPKTQGFVDKISDELLMGDFTCNERVLGTLLETGYCEKLILEQHQDGKKAYVMFLITLLKRVNSVRLTVQALRAVAILSSDVADRTTLVKQHVVNVLVPYLSEDHEDIVFEVGRALVNLTNDNANAKLEVVKESGIQYIVQSNHLSDKGPHVIETLCALIKNCLNSDEAQRKKIARNGVAESLVVLIREPKDESLLQDEGVMIKAASAIWNLCGCDDGKQDVGRAGGVEALSYLITKVNSYSVFEKACGALMMLCASHEDNKKKAIEQPELVSALVTAFADKSCPEIGVRNAAGLVSVLSTHEAYRPFKEQTSQVLDRISELLNADNKQKKIARADRLAQFHEQIQKNLG